MPDSHTIAENLTRLQTARTNIATAITTKGGTVASGAGLEDFPTAIGTIPAGGGSQDLIDFIEGNITSLSIPSGTTSIRESCFSRLRSLTSVTLPNTVTKIGSNAFSGCTSLAEINFPTSLTTIGGYSFGSSNIGDGVALTSVTLPSSVTTLGDNVFTNARKLTYADLSATNIRSVPGYTFNGCAALQTVKLPTVINSIGDYVFSGCVALTSVTLPTSLTRIGNSAFFNCTSLTSVEIPSSVTSIGFNAFHTCTALVSIKFLGSTPPTVANANAWTNIPTTCTIQVPTGSLTAYTTAAKYPDPNTYTYVEY